MTDSNPSSLNTPQVPTMPRTLTELAERLPYYVRDVSDFKCEKEIGRGGFGVVWLGKDTKTGKQVAVKELLANRLSQGESRHYIREIYTMAITNSRFVVPLVGFTVEHPFTIITRYETNGQLSHYVRHRTEKMSGTHLTITAMCIASTLVNFEEMHIIHRDIKSSNVLMDEKLLPKVCDFGTARIFSSKSVLTRRIGTINYMAPEAMTSSSYDNKADVYGFGMLLFEMCEGRIPFSDYKREQLVQLIPEQNVQLEFRLASKEIKKFILKCTDINVENRPTPKEIYKLFSSGKLSFPGTKRKRVSKINDIIVKDEQKRKTEPKKIPPQFMKMEEIMSKLDRSKPDPARQGDQKAADTIEEEGGYPNSEDDEELSKGGNEMADARFKALENSPDNDIITSLQKCKEILQPTNYQDFAFSIVRAIQKPLQEKEYAAMYELLIERVKFDLNIMENLVNCFFYQEINLSTPLLKNLGLDLFGFLFKYRPNLVKVSLTKSIASLIQFNPELMIVQLCHYVQNLPPPEDSFPVINIFTDESSIILNSPGAAENYIRILLKLLMTNQLFKEQAIRPLSLVFNRAIQSPNDELASTALLSIANLLPDNRYIMDFEALLVVAANERINKFLPPILLRTLVYPSSRRIASLLLNYAGASNRGFLSLMNYCSSSVENMKIVASMSEWVGELPTVHCTFRLFLLLFSNTKEVRPLLLANPLYQQFLLLLISNADEFLYSCLPSVLRRSYLDPTLVTDLQNNGFWPAFFAVANESQSEGVLNAALLMADTIAAIQYIPDVVGFIPKIRDILKKHPNLTQQAITVLVRMSFMKESRQQLEMFRQYFESLLAYPNYNTYASSFLANLDQQ